VTDRREVEARFGRYRALVDDWPAFAEATKAPLPRALWAHPGRVTPEALAPLIQALEPTPRGWLPGLFRLPPEARPGRHWAFWAGLFHAQEEASLLAPMLLAPRPGERVLCLCAAPGNKAAFMGARMEDRGTVVANDRDRGRLVAASATFARLGLVHLSSMHRDGRAMVGAFDRILVDAPCTAEGACRKNLNWRIPAPGFRAKIAAVQGELLARAATLLRPGGRLVYSTCTFAPEENEAVLSAFLEGSDGSTRIVPGPALGLATDPGIAAFEGRTFHPSVRHARRLWPHRNDTGGFFAAVLEKDPGAPPPEEIPSAELTSTAPADDPAMARFLDEFGLDPAAFEGQRVTVDGRFRRLVAQDPWIPTKGRLSTGLALTRRRGRHAKLGTAAALRLGRGATRRVVDLDEAGARAYRRGEDVALPAGAPASGYAIARYAGHPLGVLQVRDGGARGESLFPRGWAAMARGRR
jgi:16S rRNA C967 or C1407 C5-methylase (RsmB/RsmF family)/NOL1/NOP2/fmu family ribosome biogenesis protein